jgi:hypothetical protein
MGFFWRKKEPLPMYLIFILKIRTANSVPKRFPMKTTIGDAAHGIVPQLSSFISLEFGFHLPLHYIYIYIHTHTQLLLVEEHGKLVILELQPENGNACRLLSVSS